MTTSRQTEPFRFFGANIKGTPAMRGKAVEHDLEVLLAAAASVFVVQEFRWRWYWLRAALVLVKRQPRGERWGSSPNMAAGLARPVRGAQAVFWRRSVWRRIETRHRLLHTGHAGISESRYIRAVLLEHKATGLRVWVWTTHYVVGGDNASDGPLRRMIFGEDMLVTERFLRRLLETGHPVLGEMDGNVRKGSSAYGDFIAMLARLDLEVVGDHGVEWLLAGNGDDGEEVQVLREWIIPTGLLETDHEVRCAEVRLAE